MTKHLHIPPICLLVSGLAMWLADRFVPLYNFNTPILEQAGALLIFGGFILLGLAAAQMLKQDAAIHPHDEPKALVTNGLFKWSRNPIYLGMLIALIGWACRLNSLSPFIGPPLFAWWIAKHFIRPEEQKLIAKHDSRFRRYMATTRRWL